MASVMTSSPEEVDDQSDARKSPVGRDSES